MVSDHETQPEPPREPTFDLRRGLKVLLVVGTIVIIISVICISLDSAVN